MDGWISVSQSVSQYNMEFRSVSHWVAAAAANNLQLYRCISLLMRASLGVAVEEEDVISGDPLIVIIMLTDK